MRHSIGFARKVYHEDVNVGGEYPAYHGGLNVPLHQEAVAETLRRFQELDPTAVHVGWQGEGSGWDIFQTTRKLSGEEHRKVDGKDNPYVDASLYNFPDDWHTVQVG